MSWKNGLLFASIDEAGRAGLHLVSAKTPFRTCQITLVIRSPFYFTTCHHLLIVLVRRTVIAGMDRFGPFGALVDVLFCPYIAVCDDGGCRQGSGNIHYRFPSYV